MQHRAVLTGRLGRRCLGARSSSVSWASVASASRLRLGWGGFLASGASSLACTFLAALWGDLRGRGTVGCAAWLIWARRRSVAGLPELLIGRS